MSAIDFAGWIAVVMFLALFACAIAALKGNGEGK